MTQLELITKMQLLGSNMSRSTLANIETGRRNVKASDLKALKIIFDVYDFFRQNSMFFVRTLYLFTYI